MSLLSLLEEKGIRSTAQLAAELGTSTEMVEAKLERYAQLGYVKRPLCRQTAAETAKNVTAAAE